jgi:drug/metabolite transporter (DMT)-like permease
MGLIFWGQTQISSGLASILNATTPLFSVLLAHFLASDERLSAPRLIGVGLGIAGVAAIIGVDALAGLGAHVWAQIAVLGAALSYACAGIFGRRLIKHPPLTLAAGQLSMSSLLILPFALVLEQPWTMASPGLTTWSAVIATGVFSTALAYIIYFRLLSSAGATNLLLVTLLIPVSALALGAAFLGEDVLPRHLAGMALIGLGLAAIDGRLLRRAWTSCAAYANMAAQRRANGVRHGWKTTRQNQTRDHQHPGRRGLPGHGDAGGHAAGAVQRARP